MATAGWGAAGCTNGSLQGIYDGQLSNAAFQNVLQSLRTAPPPAAVTGLSANPNSLSGSLPGLGRYYFDGAGNIVGVIAASGTTPAFNVAIGKYTVNVDCSARVTLTSGAAYDLFLGERGRQAVFVRTDAGGGGNLGTLRRGGSCVSLNYPNSFSYAVHGSTRQTDDAGVASFAPYSVIGSLSVTGNGQFALSQSLYNSGGIQRSTASGTYTVGTDCSLTLKFSTTPGANSTNFVAPTSFRALMVDSGNGLLAIQPDSGTLVTGSLIAQ